MKKFIQRYILRPPVFFPLLAAFHWFITINYLWGFWAEPVSGLHAAWMILGSVLATALCGLQKWAGLGYIAFMIASVCCNFLLPFASEWQLAGRAFFPLEVAMGFLILFFYKRLEGWPGGAK